MTVSLHEPPRRPRPEDFGLTEEAVLSAPRTVVGLHREAWVAGLWGATAVLLLAVLLATSGSLVLSVGLTAVAVAAASVLLVPGLTALVCALELCERCVLCRRHRHYSAVLSYRQALEDHESARRRWEATRARAGVGFWTGLSRVALVHEVGRLFEARGLGVERLEDERASGFDLLLRDEGGPIAVRCEAEPPSAGLSLGREIEAARSDLELRRVILVAPSGAPADLCSYVERHGGSVLDAQALDRLGAAAS